MQVEQVSWTTSKIGRPRDTRPGSELVLYFGSRQLLASGETFKHLRKQYPQALIVGCTSGGQIHAHDVVDDEVIAVAMRFDSTQVKLAVAEVGNVAESQAAGTKIATELLAADLAGLFVLSDGLNINGSRLVSGIVDVIGKSIPLTGGLAGDGSLFEETLVGGNFAPRSHVVVGVGFYGKAVRIGHGSAGGWDVFGPWRRITRAKDNVLFELDGEPALDLYERYLGDEATGLPGTGLLFPLQIQDPANSERTIVRTILAINRDDRSLTFAGDMPEGWEAQLMRGTFNRLSDGAADAARQASVNVTDEQSGVAVLVSCIGRRLLMGQRVSEEIEAVGSHLGVGLSRLGFYSYGEISPHAASGMCELHNQTMTITTITEIAA